MNDEPRIEFDRVKADWDEARTDRLLAQVQAQLGQRRRAQRVAIASAALAAVAGAVAVVAGVRWNDTPTTTALPVPAAPPLAGQTSIHLAEGSEIGFDPAATEVRVVEQSAARVRIEAVRGPARYAVVPRPDRMFEVRSGSVVVRVIGTEFVVEPRDGATWVEVSRGKVEVSWDDGDGHAFVAAGE